MVAICAVNLFDSFFPLPLPLWPPLSLPLFLPLLPPLRAASLPFCGATVKKGVSWAGGGGVPSRRCWMGPCLCPYWPEKKGCLCPDPCSEPAYKVRGGIGEEDGARSLLPLWALRPTFPTHTGHTGRSRSPAPGRPRPIGMHPGPPLSEPSSFAGGHWWSYYCKWCFWQFQVEVFLK